MPSINIFGMNLSTSQTISGADPKQLKTPISTPIAPNNMLFLTTACYMTVGQPIVNGLWGWSIAVVDVFIALMLTLKGVTMMLTGTVFRYA
ncbi:MAG: hypothetical protein JOZ18_18125, partial [Chloroflexi bacterium]|nr:hypothetical protein [Chloroflexota bacterium]